MESSAVSQINALLRLALQKSASDIHLKTNKEPFLRVEGQLEAIPGQAPSSQETLSEFIEQSCPKPFLENWQKNEQVDYSYAPEGIGRFRVSAFVQRGTPSIVMRHVRETPPDFEQLHLKREVFEPLCQLSDGIVLLCGPTGCGKSSTLAAMLHHINTHISRHIITLEDPIEFSYTDNKSIFNQREVGIDTPSFADGLKVALRQDPDIILVGEMRDTDTFDTALTAAETGHLVLGTLHATGAQQAVQRLFEFFDHSEALSRRRQIAASLRATITQKLLMGLTGKRLPALEVFRVDLLGRRAIENGEFEKIPSIIEAGKDMGSITFNADLYRMIQDQLISKEVGLAASPNTQALQMNLKGIFLSQGGIVS